MTILHFRNYITGTSFRLLEKERLTNTELHQTLEQEHDNQHALVLRFQNTIADLQANLDMERSKVLELTSRIERDRCQSFVVNEEKSQLQEKMMSESAVCTQLRQSVKNLTVSTLGKNCCFVISASSNLYVLFN